MISLPHIPRLAAGFALAAFFGGCKFGTAPGYVPTIPQIAYESPVCDTVGRATSHRVVSTGGAIARFEIDPVLPAGLSFDSLSGLIAGTPVAARTPRDYTVIATGPDGKDTTVIRLWAVAIPYGPNGVPLAPVIAYESPAIDTVDKAASHSPYSLGGPVTSYALLTALPAGLTLDAATGTISGKPTTPLALTDAYIVANGPGGSDTATLRLAVVRRPSQQPSSQRPQIEYDSPLYDTVGKAASHAVVSTGGKVTAFALLSIDGSPGLLPAGLTLNKSTGLIAGLPEKPALYYLVKRGLAKRNLTKHTGVKITAPVGGYTSTDNVYYVVATGPGGRDTAQVWIHIAWYEEYPEVPGGPEARVTLIVNLTSAAAPQGLAKSSVMVMKKMVVTWTSNFSSDAVIRDTIPVGTSGLTNAPLQTRALTKTYSLQPLRWWTVKVRTLDARDTVIHEGAAGPVAASLNETRELTLNAQALGKYEAYQVQLLLPDSIGAAGGSFKQAVRFTRIRILLDGVPVRDTVKGSGFFDPYAVHIVEYDYVRSASHFWTVQLYADMDGWSDKPVFSGSSTISEPCPACNSSSVVGMVWTGPGSVSDPDRDPVHVINATPSPTVTIRRSRIVTVEPSPVEPLPKSGL